MSVLPHPDLQLAPTSDEASRPQNPTARFFLAPLLYVMAEAAKYQHSRVIDTSYNEGTLRGRNGSRNPIFDRVMSVAGFDPYDEDSLPYPLHSRTKPVGMYRRIWYARQENSAKYLAYKPKKKGVPLFRGSGDLWSLTEAGVAVAATIRPAFTDKDNVTQVWLSGLVTEDLYEDIFIDLERSSRLCRETPEDIRGHIAKYLASVIKNDTYRDRIIKGQPPTKRQLKEWVVNRAVSTFRRRSRTPLGRELYGARTKNERDSGEIATEAMAVSNFTTVLQQHSEDSPSTPMGSSPASYERVIVDVSATDVMEHQLAFNTVMDRIRSRVFRLFKPGASDRYERIYLWMIEGISQQELAEREGVAKSRAANLMAEVRSIIRRAAQATEDARTLIAYLQEEPFCTLEDLEDEVPNLDTDHEFLVDILVERGRIQETNGSYTVTTNGEAFLNQWSRVEEPDMALRLSL